MFLVNSMKKNQQNGIIGLDLCDRYAQVSVWAAGAEKPETLISVNQAEVSDRMPEGMNPLVWLARKCFSKPECAAGLARAQQMVVTLERIDRETRNLLKTLADELAFPVGKISCQNRAESFYYYNINQPEELWKNTCLICDFTGENMRTLLFEANRNVNPKTVAIHEEDFPEMIDYRTPGEELSEGQRRKMDQTFLDILGKICGKRVVDTIYLIGDSFEGEWYQASLPVMCKGRRVFLGDNLYSKGACYGGRTVLDSENDNRKYHYQSSDMLKADVGLVAFLGGKSVCQPLLASGTPWYDAGEECEFYLNRDNAFSLKITPSNGKTEKEVVVTLDGVPERPEKATRIRLTVNCPEANRVRLVMEDLGFGELYPATHKTWEEGFSLAEGGILN